MNSSKTANGLLSIASSDLLYSSPDQVCNFETNLNKDETSKHFPDDYVFVQMVAEKKTSETKNPISADDTEEEEEETLEAASSVICQTDTLIDKLKGLFSGFTSPVSVLSELISKLACIDSSNNNKRPMTTASEVIQQISEHLKKHFPAGNWLCHLPSHVVDQLMGALSLHLNAFWSQASWKETGKYWLQEFSAEVMPLTSQTDYSPQVTFIYAFGNLMMHFSSTKVPLYSIASGGIGLSQFIRALLPFVVLSSSTSKFSSRHYLIENLFNDICDMEENVLKLLGRMFNLTGLIEVAFKQFEVIHRQDAKKVNFLSPKFSNFYPNDGEVKDQVLAALGNIIKQWIKLLPANDEIPDVGLLLLMCHQEMIGYCDETSLLRKSFHELTTAKMIVETIVNFRGVEVWLDMKPVFGAAIAQKENVDFHSLAIVQYIESIGYAYPNVKCSSKTKVVDKKEVDLRAKEKEEIKQKMMFLLGLLKDKSTGN